MNKFSLGPQIVYGSHSLDALDKVCASNALVVTDQVMVKLGIAEKVTHILASKQISPIVFDEVEPDPSLDTVKKGLKEFLRVKPDAVVAIGGGSAIDVAKAILLLSTRLKEQFVEADKITKPTFIAIPTTSGTGSEVTSYSVVTDKQNNRKIPLNDPYMIPDVAILDENLTKTVPPFVTADTGMDVLTHALEAYVTVKSSEMTDMYSEKAMKLVFGYLLRAFLNGEDLEARGKLHLASCLAGISFTNAGLGINHSLAHALGATFHLSHGRSNAVLLPYVIAYNAGLTDGSVHHSPTAHKYAEAARMLGLPAATVVEGVNSLVIAIKELNKLMKIPVTIEQCKIEESVFEYSLADMAEAALQDICTSGNPKNPSKRDLISIYRAAYYG